MSFTNNLAKLIRGIESHSEKIAVINRRYCITEYGQQYHRFFRNHFRSVSSKSYIFSGTTLRPKDLADSIAKDVNEDELSELTVSFYTVSFYKQLSHAIKNQARGHVVIFRAHELDAETARLVDQLSHAAKKHSLDWNFILVGDVSKLARDLPRRFTRAYRIPEQVVKRKAAEKKAIKLTTISWLAITAAAVAVLCIAALIYALLSRQAPHEVAPNLDSSANTTITNEPNAEISIDIENQNSPSFDERLQEWDSLNSSEVAQIENDVIAENAGLRMSAAIDQAFNDQDTQALLEWFRTNPVDVVDNRAETALIRSLSLPSKQVFDLLLERGANYDRGGILGKTPLIYASIQGDLAAVNSLLSVGADANKTSDFNKTPLMAAVHNGYFDISELLLTHSADPNLRDQSGRTALFYAASNLDPTMEALLLSNGADINIKDSQGLDVKAVRLQRSQQQSQ